MPVRNCHPLGQNQCGALEVGGKSVDAYENCQQTLRTEIENTPVFVALRSHEFEIL